ncbi:MAG: hypothetical protein NDI67_11295 [Sulfuritalea sp.]|nr:hypothetical protein [Sulfuritalea sp.]
MTANMTRVAWDALPALNEIVGLPHAAPPEALGYASEQRFQALFRQASDGDPRAQGELVRLRLAYLNWAYAGRAV